MSMPVVRRTKARQRLGRLSDAFDVVGNLGCCRPEGDVRNDQRVIAGTSGRVVGVAGTLERATWTVLLLTGSLRFPDLAFSKSARADNSVEGWRSYAGRCCQRIGGRYAVAVRNGIKSDMGEQYLVS